MQLEHSFTVPLGMDDAWHVLLDIEQVVPCMPGAALGLVEGDHFTGTVKVRVGPISLTYTGEASYVEKDEATRRAVIEARGKDARGNGTANARVTATLHPSGDATRVGVVTDLNITGKPAQFGRGVMVDVGNKLIGQFADRLAERLKETAGAMPAEVPVAPAVAPTPEEAAGREEVAAAPVVVAAPATEAAAGRPGTSFEPVVGQAPNGAMPEPQAAGAAQPPSAQAARPQAAEAVRPEPEAINLVATALPAVLKRVVPVVLLAVLLVIVLRRWRRSR